MFCAIAISCICFRMYALCFINHRKNLLLSRVIADFRVKPQGGCDAYYCGVYYYAVAMLCSAMISVLICRGRLDVSCFKSWLSSCLIIMIEDLLSETKNEEGQM